MTWDINRYNVANIDQLVDRIRNSIGMDEYFDRLSSPMKQRQTTHHTI